MSLRIDVRIRSVDGYALVEALDGVRTWYYGLHGGSARASKACTGSQAARVRLRAVGPSRERALTAAVRRGGRGNQPRRVAEMGTRRGTPSPGGSRHPVCQPHRGGRTRGAALMPPEPSKTPTPDPHKRVWTVEEAAKVLGISRSQAYRRVADGTLPSIRFGPRSIRVPVAALARLLGDAESR